MVAVTLVRRKSITTRTILHGLGAGTMELLLWAVVVAAYWGCFWLWPGIYQGALAGKVADGVPSWQSSGIVLLFFQAMLTSQLVQNAYYSFLIETKISRKLAMFLDTVRRFVMLIVININIWWNVAVLIAIWTQVVNGRLVLSTQDRFGLVLSALAALGIVVWMKCTGRTLHDTLSFFMLAVTTRILPQGAVAFSSVLTKLPVKSVLGLLIIASQRLVMMGLEFLRARHRARKNGTLMDKKTLSSVKWTWASDGCNFASATLVGSVFIAKM